MIPEIDARGCIARNMWEGTLAFSFEADASLLDIPFVNFAGPVHAELSYRIAEDNSVEVSGTIAFALQGACSRCLEDASAEIVYDARALFLPGDGDGEAYGYRNGVVSLGEWLRESIMFALPSRLLCKACAQWEKNNSEEV